MQIFETHTSLIREINTSLLSLNEEAAHFENFNDLTDDLSFIKGTNLLNNRNMEESLDCESIEGLKKSISRVQGNLYTAPLARDAILEELMVDGWSNQVTINPHASITITSMKDRIGLCLQFGNMARFYADLLKLQHLYCSNRIIGAFYIVPEKAYAKSLGSNLANDDRLTKELSIFETTITVPIMVFGVWN